MSSRRWLPPRLPRPDTLSGIGLLETPLAETGAGDAAVFPVVLARGAYAFGEIVVRNATKVEVVGLAAVAAGQGACEPPLGLELPWVVDLSPLAPAGAALLREAPAQILGAVRAEHPVAAAHLRAGGGCPICDLRPGRLRLSQRVSRGCPAWLMLRGALLGESVAGGVKPRGVCLF